ncbi:fungal-specific transcription factor domain-containing protein [Mycena galericulata]|nr:fungal-specific transcription factor domain-containing protein [Mycena galericulata]
MFVASLNLKEVSYVEVLEARLALTEKLLHKASSSQLSTETGNSSAPSGSSAWSKDSPVLNHTKSSVGISDPALGPGVEVAAISIRTINDPPPVPEGDDLAFVDLVKNIEDLSITNHTERFMGKSSGALFVKAAVQLKEGYTTDESDWGSRRMEYWTSAPWQKAIRQQSKPSYIFPQPDVISDLIGLYFENSNIYLPLLHRPTFERAVTDDLHLHDHKFGANLLLVCTVASRFSNDPRVFDAGAPLECGWKYFSQVSPTVEEVLFATPTLYDLQNYCLAIQFLEASGPQANWSLIGMGIRAAQEVGAHRRQPGTRPTVESELWKRAFWVLVSYDRITSCTLGRPCALQHDDFDIDLPTECDDEYWEPADPSQAFRQPPGKPSRITFFNAFLRLNNILGFSLRILYSLNKAKAQFAVRDDAWEEHLVAELDSALNKWVDLIPAHLRWDPNRADPVFFRQSTALYSSYYFLQMTIHRPFIPMVRQAAPTALPSLAICTNAARSCAHVADVSCRRMGGTPVVIILPPMAIAGVVLLLNVWSVKRTGLAPHMNTTIAEVHKCMRAIRVCESRWQSAGLFWDILHELANVGQVPLPTPSPPGQSQMPESEATDIAKSAPKRRREHDEGNGDGPRYTESHEPLFQYTGAGASDPFAFADAPFAWVGAPPASTLPMYSTDLGRLPIYDSSSHGRPGGEPPTPQGQSTQYPSQPDWTVPGFVASGSSQSAFDPLASVVQGGTSAEDIFSMIDNDAMAMWVNAPTSLGCVWIACGFSFLVPGHLRLIFVYRVNEWGTYFSHMNENN